MTKLFKPLVVCVVFLFVCASFAKARVDEGVYILDPKGELLLEFAINPALTIDHVSSAGFELYGPRGLKEELTQAGVAYLSLDQLQADMHVKAADYPSSAQVEQRLRAIQKKCSTIMALTSIGKSNHGHDLWVMKVSNAPLVDQKKPEMKYISSMHGDEITGRELLQEFLDDICNNYGKDAKITSLVDSVELFVMVSMNPDGSDAQTRANAEGADLNRDFPDFSVSGDDQNTSQGRQVETQAIMRFQDQRNFSLSANFHGGAEVVNFPWDTIEDKHPEEPLFRELSLVYASRVPYIAQSSEFKDGITNGFEWYEVNGGMQDWSNHWYNDMQLTIELSSEKWPDYSEIAGFWKNNRNALYSYATMIEQGAGFYTENASTTGKVKITRMSKGQVEQSVGEYDFRHGEFYKVLEVGHYRFEISVSGQTNQINPFEIDVKKPSLIGNTLLKRVKL